LLHTIILNLAVAGKSNGHKPDNTSWMYRIASFTIAQYWRDYYYRVNGIDCGHCSNPQRKKCKRDNLYGSKCPRAIKIESLQKPITDGDGHLSELGDLIADDKALDLAEWLDINTFLLGCKALDLAEWLDINTFLLGCRQKLIDIAGKRQDGIPLDWKEWGYLQRFRKRYQKRLV